MNRPLLFLLAFMACVSPAWANFTVTTSGPTTIFAIDVANQGTSLCAASSTECPATVLIDKTGTPMPVVPLGTATEPFSIPVTPSLTARSVDPCYLQKKTTVTLTSSNTAMTQLVALANLNTIYICSILVKPNAATAFSLVEGTGTNCGSGPQAAVSGSLTAGSGVPMSGLGDGYGMSPGGTVWAIANPGNALCFQQSVAEAVSITIAYVQTQL